MAAIATASWPSAKSIPIIIRSRRPIAKPCCARKPSTRPRKSACAPPSTTARIPVSRSRLRNMKPPTAPTRAGMATMKPTKRAPGRPGARFVGFIVAIPALVGAVGGFIFLSLDRLTGILAVVLGGAQALFLGRVLGFLAQQGFAIGLRDLIIIGMDFAEGQEAVAIAAIVDERRLQRRFDPGNLG